MDWRDSMMKKTKIVCTLGPASRDEDIIRQMLKKRNECGKI